MLDLSIEGIRASTTLQSGRGWCVSKAILLAACCRSVGIPARLGFADVPLDEMTETFHREYLMDPSWRKADFESEVEQETGNN